jgi:TonB family protein
MNIKGWSIVSVALSALLVPLSGTAVPQEGGYVPPRFQSGQFPPIHPNAQNGGLVVVEIQIAASGIVTDATVVDDAPPFTEAIEKVARLWKFQPATLDGAPIASRASVVALYRAPTLLGAEPPPPERASSPSGEVPYPTYTVTPTYPPNALFEGVVAIQVEVDAGGGVESAAVLSSGQGFDSVALEAARQFRFEPAKRQGHPIPAYAVVIFGFAQPVTNRPTR